MMDDTQRREFQDAVWDYYQRHGRHDLPWRQPVSAGRFDPYHILVSELMLQQTQVNRVIPKYEVFLKRFPTVEALATTELGEVLRVWNGLGYNRRAKFLWQAARQLVDEYHGKFSADEQALLKLPGVGKGTAGAILTYAFNQPAAFIETNIRTVYIHHFFNDQTDIADAAILELVATTLDGETPREWYWALMDYGSHLKQTVGNLNHRGRHYAKQSKFEGSLRQIRGQVIRVLGDGPKQPAELAQTIADDRLPAVIETLLQEKLISRSHNKLMLP